MKSFVERMVLLLILLPAGRSLHNPTKLSISGSVMYLIKNHQCTCSSGPLGACQEVGVAPLSVESMVIHLHAHPVTGQSPCSLQKKKKNAGISLWSRMTGYTPLGLGVFMKLAYFMMWTMLSPVMPSYSEAFVINVEHLFCLLLWIASKQNERTCEQSKGHVK